MQTFDFGFERGQPPGGSLDQQQELAGFFDFALPAIDGLHASFKKIGAGGQPPRDDLSRDSLGLGPRTAGHQHDNVLPCPCFGHYSSPHGS